MNLVPILTVVLTLLASPFAGSHLVDTVVSRSIAARAPVVETRQLASKQISLEKRYGNSYVNNVFKDNILLNLSYLAGKVTKKTDIDWNEVKKPMNYKFVLLPNKTFAFHDDVLEKYKNSVVKTTNANFNFDDGFKSDGHLTGDGVCHFASLIYWASLSAGLDAYAPTSHDFAAIPEIARKFGVSIYKMPGKSLTSELQNLYVTNNKNKPIVFNFTYKDSKLKLSISEEIL
jgi:hypothetical protein